MNNKEQLETLNRSDSSTERGGRRNWASLVLLLAFVVGIALVFILIFGERLQPRVKVSVVPALLLESDEAIPRSVTDQPGTALAQASGWIEPDPFPVRVPVKVDGFVEDVFVLEGETVERGQLLAILDATNHALRVEQLEASREQVLGGLAAAEAEKTAAAARHHEAGDRLRRIRNLGAGDLSAVEIMEAERAETEMRSAVEISQAQLIRQKARVTQIEAELAQAKVDLSRTEIRAPMDGIVLRRFAAPGMKRMAAMDDPNSATIVSLYDPEQLQVRVDVPLSDAGRMVSGMSAKIFTAALTGRAFTGRITRITGEADIARNTLQVKVALEQPDPALRPEMLCRVEFFAPPSGRSPDAVRSRQVWLAEAAIADGSTTVWVVDPVQETVSQRDIEVGDVVRDGLLIVYSGLNPGERVVVEAAGRLKSGTRVSVRKD